jgi:hypothetical protein
VLLTRRPFIKTSGRRDMSKWFTNNIDYLDINDDSSMSAEIDLFSLTSLFIVVFAEEQKMLKNP